VHIDKLKEYPGVPPKSWIPSTTNGEAGTVAEEATSVSAPTVIQVNEALEVAGNRCPNSPDQTRKKSKSSIPRRGGEDEEREKPFAELRLGKAKEERNDRCVAGADKTESVSDNVSDSARKA